MASEEFQSLAIRNFQKQNNRLALEALERHQRQDRDISTITLGTTQKGFEEIKNLIVSFHDDVLKIVQRNEAAERVYQVNLQMFPLTKIMKNK